MTTDDAVGRERVRLLGAGWTERDLDEFVRRHGDHLLFMLRPLPHVLDADPDRLDRGVLRKVRALLAKAESTEFPDEAEACSAKAQELMARHRIDHLGDSQVGPGGRRIWLDPPYVRPKVALVGAVARANGCRSVHLVSLDCVHIVGYPDDLEATEVLFTSLLVQAARAIASAGPQADGRGRRRTRSFRSSFLTGFAWRIGDRLAATVSSVTAESVSEQGDLLPVLRRREEQVEAALQLAFPDTRLRRRSSVGNVAGWSAGVAAAETADLGGEAVRGPSGALAGRLH